MQSCILLCCGLLACIHVVSPSPPDPALAAPGPAVAQVLPQGSSIQAPAATLAPGEQACKAEFLEMYWACDEKYNTVRSLPQ